MRILAIDIETSPNVADVWSLWNQNVSLNQLRESSRVLCFAAQWDGDRKVQFYSEWGDGDGMIHAAHSLLSEADAVVHYNGNRFDTPHLNREFLAAGYEPPAPYKQVDLYRQIKNVFSFPSYKLAYVAPALGVGEKIEHEGHDLWVKVMAGVSAARRKMRAYNCRDTELLLPMYYKLLPWIDTLSMGAVTGDDVCPGCGSKKLRREGHAYLRTGRYQRYQCEGCGKWSRATHRDVATGITSVAS